MKTLTIGDTTYSLAYLISVKYKAKTKKDVPGTKSKKQALTGTLKSTSSLDLHFLDCDPIHFKKDKADAVWSKRSLHFYIKPDETPPAAEISAPS